MTLPCKIIIFQANTTFDLQNRFLGKKKFLPILADLIRVLLKVKDLLLKVKNGVRSKNNYFTRKSHMTFL